MTPQMKTTPEMNIAVRAVDSARIVDVTGDIDLRSAPALRRTMFETLRAAPRVALNLGAIRYIDSSGIAVMIESLKEAQRLAKPFVLFGMSPAVHDVFRLTHVLRIFQVVETEQEAIGAS